MLQRLIGLETEYATMVRSPRDQAQPPSRKRVYEAVCQQIGRNIPTARGRYDTDTMFLANGGAFSLETAALKLDKPGGLIEGATAETRSPSRLVECQRAQDRLIAEAAASCEIPGDVRIFKNSCDAQGHIYGCQENYSATVASGPMLLVYWGLLSLVLPFAMLYWTVCIAVLSLEMSLMLASRGCQLAWRFALGWLWPTRRAARIAAVAAEPTRPLENAAAADPESTYSSHPLPTRLLAITAVGLRVVNLPTALLLYGIAKTVAFRRQRKYLTAFLISRVVITGAGHVDRQNRYRLSSKAMAINTVTGFGGYWNERPIFVFHHWLQQLCGRSLLSRRSVTELFRRSQRLQIGLSDSNVSDTAEFLKVGTTSLVLDLIEAGRGRELPRLLKPIEALHRITSDWDLIARVKTTQGELSGLDIQRRYFQACRRFVSAQSLPADHEAHQVLERWEQALEALAAFRSSAVDPRPALGHIDWLTKKWMLDHLEDQQPAMLPQPAAVSGQSLLAQRTQRWAARKKIDIRYHELSEDGYFARLRCSAPELCLVDPAGIEFALRLPPSGSPASRRGQLIREFAGGAESLAVDWSHVVIGTGRERRVHVVG